MKLLICGSRWWSDEFAVLDEVSKLKPTEIIVGGARGADYFAAKAAINYDILCTTFYADWSRHGKAAGPIRNQDMVDQKPDHCLAFVLPGSRGTWDTVNRCKKAGIPVTIIKGTK